MFVAESKNTIKIKYKNLKSGFDRSYIRNVKYAQLCSGSFCNFHLASSRTQADSAAGKEGTRQCFEGGRGDVADGLSDSLLKRGQRFDWSLVYAVLDVSPKKEIGVSEVRGSGWPDNRASLGNDPISKCFFQKVQRVGGCMCLGSILLEPCRVRRDACPHQFGDKESLQHGTISSCVHRGRPTSFLKKVWANDGDWKPRTIL